MLFDGVRERLNKALARLVSIDKALLGQRPTRIAAE
jgi:hypothetical protein